MVCGGRCIQRKDPGVYEMAVKESIKEVTIKNKLGLHARPATYFIQEANKYKSSISVKKDQRKVNAKSLLGVLSLGIAKDMTVTLIADGPDEETAIAGLVELIDSGFSEV